MCVRSFSFNYYGFCGFLILFYLTLGMFGLFPIALKGLLLPLHSREHLVSSSFLFDSWWSEFPGYFIALCLSFQLLFLMLFSSMRMGYSFSYWWSKLSAYFIALCFFFHPVFLKLVFFFFFPVLMDSSYVLQGCLFFIAP